MKTNAEKIETIVKEFLKPEAPVKVKNFGNYKLLPNGQLVYRAVVTEKLAFRKTQIKQLANLILAIQRGDVVLEYPTLDKVKEDLKEMRAGRRESTYNTLTFRYLKQNTIAQKVQNGPTLMPLGNSAGLDLVERKVVFGRDRTARNRETTIQAELSKKIVMVPFNVFEQAGLDLSKLKMIEKADAETVKVKRNKYDEKLKDYVDVLEPTHFTGACLFEIEKRSFLFDIDRNEIKHGIFNAFLVELPQRAETIAEAYEILKPETVKQAEAEGINVKRQGEWFLIEAQAQASIQSQYDAHCQKLIDEYLVNSEDSSIEDAKRYSVPQRYTLQAGPNRPNYVKEGFEVDGIAYVKGVMTHAGREHKDLQLKAWHRVAVNTSRNSFTIIGDVD